MLIAVTLYLLIGTVLALDTGRRMGADADDFHWLADLAGFLVIVFTWLPVMAWAFFQSRR